jgi:C-terminal processing protease CtpA/Prc
MGVDDVVIDLINNGGGSLRLGMELAQALSNDKVVMSDMQYRLSDSWLDEFQDDSLNGPSDAERELSRRVYEIFKEDQTKGLRLSRAMSAETLMPFVLNPNKELERKFNIVLLTNEMCASMCDIFSAILKDNKMAKIVGAKTMGAGGNVVDHEQAPNSHLMVRQTESLMLRRDGTYIENNGIEPDVALDVTLSSNENYKAVKEKALDLLIRQPARSTLY